MPRSGAFRVVDLTKTQLDGWRASLVKQSDDKEVVRKSKDSANRVLTMLKAFLNHAWNDEKNAIPSDQAWRKVKPYKDVARPRDVRFSPPQARKLIGISRIRNSRSSSKADTPPAAVTRN